MLNDNQLLILIAVVIALILLVKVLEWRSNKSVDSPEQRLNSIRARLVIFSILLVGLLVAMPWSEDFLMVDYPQQFKSFDEVHAYLNNQSKMLERLSYVINLFLFFFVAFFLLDLYRMAKGILSASRSPDLEAPLPNKTLHRPT